MAVGFTSANDYISKLNKMGFWLPINCASFTTAGATRYIGCNLSSTTETDALFVTPYALTIAAFRMYCTAAPGSGQSFTFTIRKQVADSSMTGSISGGSTFDTGIVTSNAVSCAQGDSIGIKVVGSAGATSTGFRGYMLLQPAS